MFSRASYNRGFKPVRHYAFGDDFVQLACENGVLEVGGDKGEGHLHNAMMDAILFFPGVNCKAMAVNFAEVG